MIFTIFFYVGLYIVNIFLSLFPVGTGLPEIVHTVMVATVQFLWKFDRWIDVQLLLSFLGVLIVIELIDLLLHFIRWILKKIPFAHVA